MTSAAGVAATTAGGRPSTRARRPRAPRSSGSGLDVAAPGDVRSLAPRERSQTCRFVRVGPWDRGRRRPGMLALIHRQRRSQSRTRRRRSPGVPASRGTNDSVSLSASERTTPQTRAGRLGREVVHRIPVGRSDVREALRQRPGPDAARAPVRVAVVDEDLVAPGATTPPRRRTRVRARGARGARADMFGAAWS